MVGLLRSGGGGCHVETDGQFVLCSGVDHHSGCPSWPASPGPAHLSPL